MFFVTICKVLPSLLESGNKQKPFYIKTMHLWLLSIHLWKKSWTNTGQNRFCQLYIFVNQFIFKQFLTQELIKKIFSYSTNQDYDCSTLQSFTFETWNEHFYSQVFKEILSSLQHVQRYSKENSVALIKNLTLNDHSYTHVWTCPWFSCLKVIVADITQWPLSSGTNVYAVYGLWPPLLVIFVKPFFLKYTFTQRENKHWLIGHIEHRKMLFVQWLFTLRISGSWEQTWDLFTDNKKHLEVKVKSYNQTF